MERGCVPVIVALLCVGPIPACRSSIQDDGRGRSAADFPELSDDVFQGMDGGISLSADEIKGRNTWILWCAGNEQFWDRAARESYGLIDLIKTVDSRNRTNRFKTLGLINEPGFRAAKAPDQYGLWLDERLPEGHTNIDVSVYGYSTGIVGFRLFKNPDFRGRAARAWNPARYYTDSVYAANPDLVRPYRIGVSCAACHVAFNPCKPPTDTENPAWENLSSAIGNQYIREGKVFASLVREGGFLWELFATQPPGTSDTSRIATDHINNPSAINAIVNLPSRMMTATVQNVSRETLLLPQISGEPAVPLLLKDGADSVGLAAAALRVYVNIGMYSQHWLEQHQPLLGLRPQRPFSIITAQAHSVYWVATQQKVTNVVRFLTRLRSCRLTDVPDGHTYVTNDIAVIRRGRTVFAENCAECHSSKRPPPEADPVDWFRTAIQQPEFDRDNVFSDGRRHPITKIKSNAARAFATNAKAGNIWHHFSSDSYKAMPSPGAIAVWDVVTGRTNDLRVPEGNGYYLTPSLSGLWSTAPFLHNNALGKYAGDPSVKGRMEAFSDAIEKLLWPDRRWDKKSVWRTSRECTLTIPFSLIPKEMRPLFRAYTDQDSVLRLGPIPAGTPVNLLANIDTSASPRQLLHLYRTVKDAFTATNIDQLRKSEALQLLVSLNRCPDFVEDRGHYFGADLPDDDKRALIEFLKTL